MLARPSAPLPGFRSPRRIIAGAAASIRPPAKVTPSECAERHRMLRTPGGYSGPWRNAKTPYLVEIMDCAVDRRFSLVVLVGPSQFGKSEVFLNLVTHAAKYRPGDMLVLQPTKDMAQTFAEVRVEQRLIRVSPALASELGPSKSDDKTFTKQFRNGTRLDVVWPTPTQLASRPVPTVLLDERDRIANDIAGEGDPVGLAKNRIKTFRENGVVVAVSSPARDALSPIIQLYAEGSRELWAWPCPACGEFWTPGFAADGKPSITELVYRADGSADEAAESARLCCPACGEALEERQKAGMNARGAWIPAGCTIDRDGRILGRRPTGRTRSFWFCGLASPFQSWAEIAAEIVAAERAFERTADESKLKTVWNTVLGFPYRPRALGALPLEAAELGKRRQGYQMRTVPPGVRFLTAAVDTGGRCWDVLVQGWDEEGSESWFIDRFAIRQLEDGATDVAPGQYPEHWRELLRRVFWARYELVERPGWFLPVAHVAIDTGGVDGVWDNARSFYAEAREAGVAEWGISLIKGASRPDAPPIRPPSVHTFQRDPKARKVEIPLYSIGVSTLKDMVENRLRRDRPGAGYVHMPTDFPQAYLDELAAEVKEGGVWVRKGANETLDCAVYNAFAAMRMRPRKVRNWDAPPSWARAEAGAAAVPPAADGSGPGGEAGAQATPAPASRPDGADETIPPGAAGAARERAPAADMDPEATAARAPIVVVPMKPKRPARAARRPGAGSWAQSWRR